jgi:uncharacterized protein YnzC (UPF0291/DUF896 family)
MISKMKRSIRNGLSAIKIWESMEEDATNNKSTMMKKSKYKV